MKRHGLLRTQPQALHAGTLSIVTARMNYLPTLNPEQNPASFANDLLPLHSKEFPRPQPEEDHNASPTWTQREWQRLQNPQEAVVSLYARGRDYHKVMKQRLGLLAEKIQTQMGPLGYRVFTDSAPVMEVQLATQSGLGWRGKHTLALHRGAGSMFFLGEIFINQDLTQALSREDRARYDQDSQNHCGSCQACIEVCPTQAIVAPYVLDARRCISYLTIEHKGSVDEALRPLMGNRIYGCDDCQLICPWNKYAKRAVVCDFDVREHLNDKTLLELWSWQAADFDRLTQGQAIRRIGFEQWVRNLAIALGNALRQSQDPQHTRQLLHALSRRRDDASVLVREHVQWALEQHTLNQASPEKPTAVQP